MAATNQQGNALVKPQENTALKELGSYLKQRESHLKDYALGRLKPATMIRLALFHVSKDSKLMQCRPESIYAALVLAAQLGLEPSGVKGSAYLVPYKGNCQLIPGYRGLVDLARKSKVVTDLYAHVAYEGDVCKVNLGSEPRVEHEPGRENRGKIDAAYAVAYLDGARHPDIEFMSREDLDELVGWVKAQRGGNLPDTYQQWPSEMLRKAPLRRLCKRLPAGEEFERAVMADNLAEQGKSAEEVLNVIDTDGVEVTNEKTAQDATAEAISRKNA